MPAVTPAALSLAWGKATTITFMEKDRHQQSRLSSLADWKARKDLRIEKGYLQGRFGGVPFIGDTKKLMDMIQCPVNGTRNEKKTSS